MALRAGNPEVLHYQQDADWMSGVAARGLAVACALNLNGVFSMAFDLGQAVSLVMLVTSLFLILRHGHAARSAALALFFLAIVSYLILATIFYDPFEAVYEPEKFYQAYGGAILIVWGISGYVASLQPGFGLGQFLRFVRNSFLISAASVWASPLLYKFYVNLPLSSQQRMGGFFANPNEAAIASLLAVILTLGMPFRLRLLQLALVLMAAGAVVLTFSKTAMTCLIVILGWYVFQRARSAILFVLPVAVSLAVITVQDIDNILLAMTENEIVEFDQVQKDRILAVGKILGGEIDERTTTGRTYLWQLVAEKAWDRFPFGSGIGSAHNIVGGVLENDVWQGAHNSFIMILGESGPFPALLLAASMVALFLGVRRSAAGSFEWPCLLILGVDMMATHTALSTRYHNLALAMLLGLVANASLTPVSRLRRVPVGPPPPGPLLARDPAGEASGAPR
jgi:O-antigen ligase